jgi:hypothetical protein
LKVKSVTILTMHEVMDGRRGPGKERMMKKSVMSVIVVSAFAFVLASDAATINQTVVNLDWNAAMWGSPEAAPTSGNDYVAGLGTVRIQADASSGTFGGDSLTIDSGATALSKLSGSNVATVNGTLTLNGGDLNVGPSIAGTGATLATDGFTVSADSGIFINNSTDGFFITGGLSGSGDLLLQSSYSDAGGRFISFDSVGDYTGTIDLTENVKLDFASDVTFGGILYIDPDSVLNVGSTLTFPYCSLRTNGVAVPVGTYTGAAITALGANFADDGGTLIVPAHQYVEAIAGQNPQGYWRFNESAVANSTVLATVGPDASAGGGVLAGENSAPALVPPAYTFWTSNTAYSFDASSGAIVSLDGTLMDASEGSVSFWFRTDGSTIDSSFEIMWYASESNVGNGAGAEEEMHVDISSSGQLRFFIENDAADINLYTVGSSYTDDTWHHVVATWSGTATALYVDGGSSLNGGETITGASAGQSWVFSGGCHRFGKPATSTREYGGKADELAVWNTALTAAQAKAQYLAAIPTGTMISIR